MNAIKRLEALAEKATARPWVAHSFDEEVGISVMVAPAHGGYIVADLDVDETVEPRDTNAEFIAAAVNALPDLLKVARAAHELNESVSARACAHCWRELSVALKPLFREVEP